MDHKLFNESRIDLTYQTKIYEPIVDRFKDSPGIVYDLACGRGTMLDIFKNKRIVAIGVDNDPSMVEYTRIKGHEVIEADVCEFITNLRGAGGIVSAHLVEHLPRTVLMKYIKDCANALITTGKLILITPNPQSLFVQANVCWQDPTHVAPIHIEALKFLVQEAELTIIESFTASSLPVEWKLELTGNDPMDRNVHKLNDLIYSDMDIVLVAMK